MAENIQSIMGIVYLFIYYFFFYTRHEEFNSIFSTNYK